MRISIEALIKLKADLPRGSVPVIRQRLLRKKISFSHQYIYRCLDPNQPDYNPLIIDEAISLCEELIRGAEDMQERILQLKKALQ